MKSRSRNVGIVFRRKSKPAQKTAQKLAAWLSEQKIKSFSHPDQTIAKDVPKWSGKPALDLLIALGGDGTYLDAIRMTGNVSVPTLGINLGSLGFLTVHPANDILETVKLALDGRLEAQERSMLQIEVIRQGQSRGRYLALNDIVMERGSMSHLIHMGVHVDRELINTIKADGLIIATPTGSTAYNLAAGGPILHPCVRALVVTSICPHSLTTRPFIFPDDREMSFSLIGDETKAMLTVDGIKVNELTSEDKVRVKRSKRPHITLRKPGHNYFLLLREKLKFGERV